MRSFVFNDYQCYMIAEALKMWAFQHEKDEVLDVFGSVKERVKQIRELAQHIKPKGQEQAASEMP